MPVLLPKVTCLVSHRNESTKVLDGHFNPHWWTSCAPSTMDSVLFPVIISWAGLALSVLSLLGLFIDTLAPTASLRAGSSPYIQPWLQSEKKRNLWTILQCPLIPNFASSPSAVSFTQHALPKPLCPTHTFMFYPCFGSNAPRCLPWIPAESGLSLLRSSSALSACLFLGADLCLSWVTVIPDLVFSLLLNYAHLGVMLTMPRTYC